MFQSFTNRFLVLGSAGVMAVSLALPPPILESRQGTAIDSLSTRVILEQPPHKQRPLHVEKELHTEKVKEPQASVRPLLSIPNSIVVPSTETGAVREQQGSYTLATLSSLIMAREARLGTALSKTPARKKNEPPVEKEELPLAQKPVIGVADRIAVPSIGIDIAVQSGSYSTATESWMVDDTSAFHADTTVPINDTNGTTLIYGHARRGIFGNLPDIRSGAEANVHTADGSRFVYEFESVRQVDPTDVSMLTSDGTPKLILQTCSGLFDQHRTLATFSFKEVIRS